MILIDCMSELTAGRLLSQIESRIREQTRIQAIQSALHITYKQQFCGYFKLDHGEVPCDVVGSMLWSFMEDRRAIITPYQYNRYFVSTYGSRIQR